MRKENLLILAIVAMFVVVGFLGAAEPARAYSCIFDSDCYTVAPCARCLANECYLLGCDVAPGGPGAFCYDESQCQNGYCCVRGYCDRCFIPYGGTPGTSQGEVSLLFFSPGDLIARLGADSGGCG